MAVQQSRRSRQQPGRLTHGRHPLPTATPPPLLLLLQMQTPVTAGSRQGPQSRCSLWMTPPQQASLQLTAWQQVDRRRRSSPALRMQAALLRRWGQLRAGQWDLRGSTALLRRYRQLPASDRRWAACSMQASTAPLRGCHRLQMLPPQNQPLSMVMAQQTARQQQQRQRRAAQKQRSRRSNQLPSIHLCPKFHCRVDPAPPQTGNVHSASLPTDPHTALCGDLTWAVVVQQGEDAVKYTCMLQASTPFLACGAEHLRRRHRRICGGRQSALG